MSQSVAIAEETNASPATRQKKRSKRLDEHCLTLARRILKEANDAPISVGMTSCGAGEGVSTILANTAACAASVSNRRVLVVDANPRGGVTKKLRVKKTHGWNEVVNGEKEAADCVYSGPVDDLFVMPYGKGSLTSYNEDLVTPLLTSLKEHFSLILVDLPPATDRSNTFSLASALDGVVLVMEAERIRSKVAARTRDQFERAGAELLGVVLNKRDEHIPNWLYRRL